MIGGKHRILVVFPSSFLGGSELSAMETIKSLGNKIDIYIVLPSDGALKEKLVPYCKEVNILDYSWWASKPAWSTLLKFKMIKGFISSTLDFYYHIKQVKADVVITNTMTIPSAALASKFAGVSHIWYLHELGKEDHGLIFNYGNNFSLWFMNRTTRLFVVNSENVRRNFANAFNGKIRLINYAVELKKIDRVEEKPLYDIIFLGRIAKGKNPEDLVRALYILKNENYRLKVCMMGHRDESYYKYLVELATQLEVIDQIIFREFEENVSNALSASKMFVMCSQNEAFGRVTIESMKCKVPVIVANKGSGPDIVSDGVTGLLYQFQNPADLAEKIKFYISHEKERQVIAERAYAWANENFNLTKHGKEMSEAIEEAIAQ